MLKSKKLEVVKRIRSSHGILYRCRESNGAIIVLNAQEFNQRMSEYRKLVERAQFDGHRPNVSIRLRQRRNARRARMLQREGIFVTAAADALTPIASIDGLLDTIAASA